MAKNDDDAALKKKGATLTDKEEMAERLRNERAVQKESDGAET